MKNNWAFRLAGLAIVLTLVTSSLVAGTYAKYVTTVTGNDTARVAKFAFNLKDAADATIGTQATTTTLDLDIFDYTDTGVYNDGVNGTDKLIAPGTTGSFVIEVDNLSEVDVTVAFALTETNTGNIPIYYTYEGQRYSSVLIGTYETTETYATLETLATDMAADDATLQATNGTTATTATYTLGWTWAFEDGGTGQTDVLDTALGMAAISTVALQIATTVTQIN